MALLKCREAISLLDKVRFFEFEKISDSGSMFNLSNIYYCEIRSKGVLKYIGVEIWTHPIPPQTATDILAELVRNTNEFKIPVI
jgi:hypothetical protein